jgi:hypothetical protein
MRKALKHTAEGLHLLIDNDADLSVHPAQIGILIEDIVEGRAKAVAGSRREVDSVALIGRRETRGATSSFGSGSTGCPNSRA